MFDGKQELSTSEAVAAANTEALFREVNERIAETAARFEADEAEFVCECSDSTCTHRVPAPLPEYEEVRSDATRFLVARGHADRRIEHVVEREGAFDVVQKMHGVVASAVRRLDPRAA